MYSTDIEVNSVRSLFREGTINNLPKGEALNVTCYEKW